MRVVLLLALVSLAPAASAADVSMLGGFFAPDAVALAPGEPVTWTNDDDVAHTVTSSWDAGATFDVVLRPGESFTYAFAEVGAFAIHCRPHAYVQDDGSFDGMVMSFDVQAASTAPPADAAPGLGTMDPSLAVAAAVAAVTLLLVGATTLRQRRPQR